MVREAPGRAVHAGFAVWSAAWALAGAGLAAPDMTAGAWIAVASVAMLLGMTGLRAGLLSTSQAGVACVRMTLCFGVAFLLYLPRFAGFLAGSWESLGWPYLFACPYVLAPLTPRFPTRLQARDAAAWESAIIQGVPEQGLQVVFAVWSFAWAYASVSLTESARAAPERLWLPFTVVLLGLAAAASGRVSAPRLGAVSVRIMACMPVVAVLGSVRLLAHRSLDEAFGGLSDLMIVSWLYALQPLTPGFPLSSGRPAGTASMPASPKAVEPPPRKLDVETRDLEIVNRDGVRRELHAEVDELCDDWLSVEPDSAVVEPGEPFKVLVRARRGKERRLGRIRVGGEEIKVVVDPMDRGDGGPS